MKQKFEPIYEQAEGAGAWANPINKHFLNMFESVIKSGVKLNY